LEDDVIVHSRLDSRHLAANVLGDPSERDVFIYLPPGYEASDRRYPVAYLLHALGDSAATQVTPAAEGPRWQPPLEDVLDPVFGRLRVPPMIVVIPDGWSSYGCGQWVDSSVTGNFEQYVIHDVIPFVDAAYRSIPTAASRGVFGFSSCGFGSWTLASQHPDVLGAMAVLSADSWLDMTHKYMLFNWRGRVENLKQLRGIFLDAGQKDDHNLHWGHRLLSHYLTEAGVAHVHTENPGNHGGRWPERYQMALTWLADVLEHAPS
jgi:enterochelin esterase-like enzyme